MVPIFWNPQESKLYTGSPKSGFSFVYSCDLCLPFMSRKGAILSLVRSIATCSTTSLFSRSCERTSSSSNISSTPTTNPTTRASVCTSSTGTAPSPTSPSSTPSPAAKCSVSPRSTSKASTVSWNTVPPLPLLHSSHRLPREEPDQPSPVHSPALHRRQNLLPTPSPPPCPHQTRPQARQAAPTHRRTARAAAQRLAAPPDRLSPAGIASRIGAGALPRAIEREGVCGYRGGE